MKVLFRTDASTIIGLGHVMRCLTLAKKLREKGAECEFVCREYEGNYLKEINKNNFRVYALPSNYNKKENKFNIKIKGNKNSSLSCQVDYDANETRLAVNRNYYDWIIVDHYALDKNWERKIKSLCKNLMVIDDLANREHVCNLLLDQNLGRVKKHYQNLVPNDCKILLGPKFALLRPEFNLLREKSLIRRKAPKLKKLIITFGGSDPENISEKVLKMLVNIPLVYDHQISIIFGPHAPWKENVKLLSKNLPINIKIKENVKNMAEIMLKSDLAIGAAGSTSWERCTLGLPSIVCAFADNQTFILNALNSNGISKVFFVDDKLDNLRKIILNLMDNPKELLKMVENSSKITDGLGSERVSTEMKKLIKD